MVSRRRGWACGDRRPLFGNERLPGCKRVVRIEPGAMWAGGIQHAGIERLVFGARDPKTGACGSVIDLFDEPRLNHHARVTGGVLASECGQRLSTFFADRRRVSRAMPAVMAGMLPDALDGTD